MNGRRRSSFSYRALSRTFDIMAALLGLIVCGPLMALISLLILASMGAPVLFRQNRAGLNGKIFQLLKFRTMTNDRDKSGALLPDYMRLTLVGRLLRRSSLDELPQLWNVLKGEMSIVGPRPLLPEYLPLYSPRQYRRHIVKPGIVGWAVVNGRNCNTWERKFELDLYYVNNQSLFLDAKIIIMAIRTALSGKGVNEQGQATVSKFTGSKTPS